MPLLCHILTEIQPILPTSIVSWHSSSKIWWPQNHENWPWWKDAAEGTIRTAEKRAKRIISDHSHPGHHLISLLLGPADWKTACLGASGLLSTHNNFKQSHAEHWLFLWNIHLKCKSEKGLLYPFIPLLMPLLELLRFYFIYCLFIE